MFLLFEFDFLFLLLFWNNFGYVMILVCRYFCIEEGFFLFLFEIIFLNDFYFDCRLDDIFIYNFKRIKLNLVISYFFILFFYFD